MAKDEYNIKQTLRIVTILDIRLHAQALFNVVSKPGKIPDSIVNGSYTETQKFLAASERAYKLPLEKLSKQPNNSTTTTNLKKVHCTLKTICADMRIEATDLEIPTHD